MTAPGAIKKVDAHAWEREANEHYVEPHWCSERLFDEEKMEGTIWDPCCGFGRIPDAAKKAGHGIIATDIVTAATVTCSALAIFSRQDGLRRMLTTSYATRRSI
jgi:hypothetical protein